MNDDAPAAQQQDTDTPSQRAKFLLAAGSACSVLVGIIMVYEERTLIPLAVAVAMSGASILLWPLYDAIDAFMRRLPK